MYLCHWTNSKAKIKQLWELFDYTKYISSKKKIEEVRIIIEV